MNSVSIQFNDEQIAEVYRTFGSLNDMPNKIFSRAINRTMDGAKTDMSTAIRSVLNAKKKDVDRLILISRCSPGTLFGRVTLSGKLLPLRAFNPKQTSSGVTVRLYKNKDKSSFQSAFIATMKSSGYVGVFRRKWHESKSKKRGKGMPPAFLRKTMARQGYFYNSKTKCFVPAGILPKPYRLPIKQIFAPSQVTIFIADEIFNPFKESVDRRLDVDLQREINYEMGNLNR